MKCRVCGGPIAIPGLDSDKCSKCGWVPALDYLAAVQAKSERRVRSGRNKDSAAGNDDPTFA